ncbi:MAG: hypothetical protein QXP70_05215, partial [Methanomassiliicoccales archaeon]
MKLIKASFVVLSALILLSASGLAAAEGHSPYTDRNQMPIVQQQPERLIVANSHIVVWFQGFKPLLHIFYRGQDGNITGLTVAVENVFELNSTGAPDAFLPMTRAYPFFGFGEDFNYNSGLSMSYNN